MIPWHRQIVIQCSGYQSFPLMKQKGQSWAPKGWECFSSGFSREGGVWNCGLSAASSGGCSASYLPELRLSQHVTATSAAEFTLRATLCITTSGLSRGLLARVRLCEADSWSQLGSAWQKSRVQNSLLVRQRCIQKGKRKATLVLWRWWG